MVFLGKNPMLSLWRDNEVNIMAQLRSYKVKVMT